MPLIPAKCTQCGANIEVDDTKEAGICPHCGTAFITEKAITNYNTTNVVSNTYQQVTNVQGNVVHVHQAQNPADKLFNDIQGLFQMGVRPYKENSPMFGDERTLCDRIEQFRDKYPVDYRRYEIAAMILSVHPNIKDEYESYQKFKLLKPELEKQYRAKVVEAANETLSDLCKTEFAGELLSLKHIFWDLKELLDDELEKQRKLDKALEEYKHYVVPVGGVAISHPSKTHMPANFKPLYKAIEEGERVLSQNADGVDADYTMYIAERMKNAANDVCFKNGNKTALLQFAQTLFNSVPEADKEKYAENKRARESKEREEKERKRNEFFKRREQDYRDSWSNYVSKRKQYVNNCSAEALQEEAKKIYRRFGLTLAKEISEKNFKKRGLFIQKLVYQCVISDNDVESLTQRSMQEFKAVYKG